jgi:hypothetical protein
MHFLQSAHIRLSNWLMNFSFAHKKSPNTVEAFSACKILAMSRLAGVETGLFKDKQRSCFPTGERTREPERVQSHAANLLTSAFEYLFLTPTKKAPTLLRLFLLVRSWRCPTLTWELPHYHRRCHISLLSSRWVQVVLWLYCHQKTGRLKVVAFKTDVWNMNLNH